MSISELYNTNIDVKPESNIYCQSINCYNFNVNTITAKSLALTNPTNQIIFDPSSGHQTTLNVPVAGQNQIITLPDSGTSSSNFILQDASGQQTINSNLQLNGNVTTTVNITATPAINITNAGTYGTIVYTPTSGSTNSTILTIPTGTGAAGPYVLTIPNNVTGIIPLSRNGQLYLGFDIVTSIISTSLINIFSSGTFYSITQDNSGYTITLPTSGVATAGAHFKFTIAVEGSGNIIIDSGASSTLVGNAIICSTTPSGVTTAGTAVRYFTFVGNNASIGDTVEFWNNSGYWIARAMGGAAGCFSFS